MSSTLSNTDQLQTIARQLRRWILQCTHRAASGHPTSSMSGRMSKLVARGDCLRIMACLPAVSEFSEGVYEKVRTVGLDEALAGLPPEYRADFAGVDPADAPDVVAWHVAEAVRRVIANETDTEQRVALTNDLLARLAAPEEQLPGILEHLVALNRAGAPAGRALAHPVTPLSQAALLTNAKDEPSLSTELRAELASADRVDLLCAFIRWHGLRVLEDQLAQLSEHGVPFRVLTTTYVGATERRALDELVRRFGAEVRISYETQSTRLHAKAWLFRRDSGYDTAFVGSSNLSRSALVDGLEWNVRLSAVATPGLVRKFAATFDSYWESNQFVSY
jgi:HKD family nuclease